MPRKKNPNTPPKPSLITDEELDFLASMGPTFAEGVNRVKACYAEVNVAKQTLKEAKKKQRTIFRKLRKAARLAVEA